MQPIAFVQCNKFQTKSILMYSCIKIALVYCFLNIRMCTNKNKWEGKCIELLELKWQLGTHAPIPELIFELLTVDPVNLMGQ